MTRHHLLDARIGGLQHGEAANRAFLGGAPHHLPGHGVGMLLGVAGESGVAIAIGVGRGGARGERHFRARGRRIERVGERVDGGGRDHG